MKLSVSTLELLKNYAKINPGLVFQKGTIQKTIGLQPYIIAQGKIDEDIPQSFNIYELDQFLSALSMLENPDIELKNDHCMLVELGGKRKIKYVYAADDIIISPKKTPKQIEPLVTFTLSVSDMKYLFNAAGVFKCPHISVKLFADGALKMLAHNAKETDDEGSVTELVIDNPTFNVTGKTEFCIVFKTENLKLLEGNYDVEVAGTVGHFINKDRQLEYHVIAEASETKV